MLQTWLKELSELVLPSVETCPLCGSRRKPGRSGLCCICQKELDYWEEKYHQCHTCGRFIPPESSCQGCCEQPPPFEKAVAVGPYRGVLKDSLYSLKFRGDRKLAHPLGRLMAHKIRSKIKLEEIEAVIPVPLHPDKLKIRGFNQAELLAREVARATRIPVVPNLLAKTAETSAQTHLTQKEREANLKGVFGVRGGSRVKGKAILLVDDIFTTGSTAAECSRTLLQGGAKKVYVGIVATGIQFFPMNHPHPEGFNHPYSQLYPHYPQGF